MTPKLDSFTRGYLEAALWTSDPDPGSGQWSEHDDWTIDNIAPESLARAIEDCRQFQADNRADLDEVTDTYGATDAQHGHDFFLTRCGHGTGFWDRGYGALGKKLTEAAHVWGNVDVMGPETNDHGGVDEDKYAEWDRVIYIS